MNNNFTKVVCPVCGTEMSIPANSFTVKNAQVIGEDSGLGTVVLKPKNKAQDRLEALRKAGVDTDGLFAMRGASGGDVLVRLKDGELSQVTDDDPIFKEINEKGTIPNRDLFRRWVTSQMFHMLNFKGYSRYAPGYTGALHAKGYEYSWKMIVEEMNVQSRLNINDKENFYWRNLWFNDNVILAMAKDYMEKLHKKIHSLRVRRCKGQPYVKLGGSMIFLSNIKRCIFEPLEQSITHLTGNKPMHRAKYLSYFNDDRLALGGRLDFDTPFCREWVEAYKGSGAYFTLKNLILFHGCRLEGKNTNDSIRLLNEKAIECSKKGDGWRMLAMLKQCLKDNNIDIEAKMRSWSK